MDDNQKIYFIGLKDFMKSKQITHRSQDLADLKELEKFKKNRKK